MGLIGGIWDGSALRRDFAFKPVTGALELLLDELVQTPMSRPEQVSHLLAAALDSLGGQPADFARVHGLSVGDRQHLMRQLSARLGCDLVWLNARCSACGEGFDIQIRQSAMPVKPAGKSFPTTTVTLRGDEITLRVPTGVDQAAIAAAPARDETEAALLARLIETAPAFAVDSLDPAELEQLEAAVEEVAPEVATDALARCATCEADNLVPVDPYLCLSVASGELFAEIHTLASNYHWSEAAILALPQQRRKRYIGLIDRQHGMIGRGDLAPGTG